MDNMVIYKILAYNIYYKIYISQHIIYDIPIYNTYIQNTF